MKTDCKTAKPELARLFDQGLPFTDDAELQAHVGNCRSCQEYADFLTGLDVSISSLQEKAVPQNPMPEISLPERGKGWQWGAAAAAAVLLLWMLLPGRGTHNPGNPAESTLLIDAKIDDLPASIVIYEMKEPESITLYWLYE